MDEQTILERITINPQLSGGKAILRQHLEVERVLALLANGETFETLLKTYPWLEREDLQACLLYARQLVLQDQTNPIHKQPKTLADLTAKLPQILEQVPYLRLLVVFGSRARGDHNIESDWDFGFLCDEELRKQYENKGWNYFRVWGILQQVYQLGDDQIDAVDMRKCSNILAHNIAADGKVIYELKPGEFAAFQREKLIAPEEMKRLQEEMREQLRERIQELQK